MTIRDVMKMVDEAFRPVYIEATFKALVAITDNIGNETPEEKKTHRRRHYEALRRYWRAKGKRGDSLDFVMGGYAG